MTFCECSEPRETANPRKAGSCVKCGKHFDPEWTSSDQTMTEFFNRLSSCRFLEESFPAFRQMCERRERAGRDTFGFSYLVRDNLEEAREELSDAAVYMALDILKARHDGTDECADLALTVAYHASRAFDALGQLQHKRGGEP